MGSYAPIEILKGAELIIGKAEWKSPTDPDFEDRRVNTREFRSIDELKIFIDTLHNQALADSKPFVIGVATPEEHHFSIGVGHPLGSHLTYDGYKGDPPYYISVGDATNNEYVWFSFMGTQSELPADTLISYSMARNAFLDCVMKGQPSDKIRWHCG